MGTAYKELFKLYDLIQNGETRSVKTFLLETQIDVNVIIPCKGIAILHLAVGVDPLEKATECTELLLKHGANPNLCNEDGLTPIHIAAIWGRTENLRLLIGCGGDPSLQDFDGLSAFDYAAQEQQWEVYDYLKNVMDDNDDSDDPQCAYTLDLDKILVTTDDVVAEYEQMTEEPNTTIRKSELVRDWCDTNSLVFNKLYPTILSDTYLIDNQSVPWHDKNITLDLTKDSKETDDISFGISKVTNDLTRKSKSSKETEDLTRLSHISDNSFKTCQSSKSVEISGVKPLEATNCSECLKRTSVYENFSLPGSPKNISHTNYKSKSSLRCKKNGSASQTNSLCSELNKLSLESSCSMLDKAIAVVQNRTNEQLCTDGNTRRSSASSGVSSNYSTGSILVASVHEEYKYKDKQEDVVLIEKRLLLQPVVLPLDEACDGSPEQTVVSVASSLPTALQYSDRALRAELTRLGYSPGPIQDSTRTLYLRKLRQLQRNPAAVSANGNKKTAFSVEMEKSLRSEEWMRALGPYEELERRARSDFGNPARAWREGKSKTSFTYLLLDPRLTGNLPAATHRTKLEMWTTFVHSIFYVGKGKRSRPYAHLYQALTLWKRGFTSSNDKKIQHILNIWQNKVGVVCLHIFQNVIPAEAFTYEAAMIDAIGINNLKNLKNGTYYGLPATWPHKERRMLGLYLLYKAMGIFINEGERQLRPDDI